MLSLSPNELSTGSSSFATIRNDDAGAGKTVLGSGNTALCNDDTSSRSESGICTDTPSREISFPSISSEAPWRLDSPAAWSLSRAELLLRRRPNIVARILGRGMWHKKRNRRFCAELYGWFDVVVCAQPRRDVFVRLLLVAVSLGPTWSRSVCPHVSLSLFRYDGGGSTHIHVLQMKRIVRDEAACAFSNRIVHTLAR